MSGKIKTVIIFPALLLVPCFLLALPFWLNAPKERANKFDPASDMFTPVIQWQPESTLTPTPTYDPGCLDPFTFTTTATPKNTFTHSTTPTFTEENTPAFTGTYSATPTPETSYTYTPTPSASPEVTFTSTPSYTVTPTISPTPLTGCPDDMSEIDSLFCMDKYEASRPDATDTWAGGDGSYARSVAGVMPWEVVDNATAQAACQAVGKRLCSPDEWYLACRGTANTVYVYGNTYEPTTCNGINAYGYPEVYWFQISQTGSFPGCVNEWGVYDINGNLWEHTLNGDNTTIRGGAFNCSDSEALHRCDYIPGFWAPSARGFRCCSDLP